MVKAARLCSRMARLELDDGYENVGEDGNTWRGSFILESGNRGSVNRESSAIPGYRGRRESILGSTPLNRLSMDISGGGGGGGGGKMSDLWGSDSVASCGSGCLSSAMDCLRSDCGTPGMVEGSCNKPK